ncbi:MAG: insulinase family protein, partial [Thermodesulfovibrionales bacterium]|nr:insulinase family protein [Thermodesulfovibrionales bacterium]
DLDAGELEALLKKHLGTWRGTFTGTGTGPEKPALPAPAAPEPRRVLNEMDITQANIYFGHLGLNRSHPDYYAVQVMNYAMGGGGFSSRLMDQVRDDMGLAYGIHSTFSPYMGSGVFYVNVQTRNDSALRVVEVIRSIISDVRDNGITEDELDAAKAYLTGSFPRRLSTIGKTARFLALVEYFGLGLDYPEEYISTINALTLDDMRKAGRKYLRPARAVLSIAADLEEAGLDKKK